MAMHPLRSTPRKPVIDYHGARITDSALQGVFGTYEYIEMELAELSGRTMCWALSQMIRWLT
jgi:hypothetical protein